MTKIKDGAYGIDLDDNELIGTHWIALCVNWDNVGASNDAKYFDSFQVKHILEKITRFIGNKNITVNVFTRQARSSTMCGYFCIGLIDFMLKCKSLLD